MKKLNLLLGFLIGIMLFSCSSDDDSNESNQDELIGIWNLVSVENQGNDVTAVDCQIEQNIIFTANNTGTEKAPEEITQTPCDFFTVSFNWTRNGNEIAVVVAQEGTFLNEILLLTENTLEIVVTEIDGVAVPQNQQEIFKYEK
ncbi:lipocalin family protein [Winogradskyella pacifica]|uniref:lipocalin family protein n=1 Tax=Winogradskyella pacifica TaxID=664642 RepID=UPI0015CC622C|nr:lipocalin family protein [Winogradskyella pacifica]